MRQEIGRLRCLGRRATVGAHVSPDTAAVRGYNPGMGLMRSGPDNQNQGKHPSLLVIALWLVVVVVLVGWIAAFALHV